MSFEIGQVVGATLPNGKIKFGKIVDKSHTGSFRLDSGYWIPPDRLRPLTESEIGKP